MHRHAGHLTGSVQALYGFFAVEVHLGLVVRGNTAHCVVCGGEHRDRLVVRLNRQVGAGELGDVRQLLVNVRVKTKAGWEENTAIRAAIAEGERILGSEGRVLVRPSGTEPLIRVMAEGSDQTQLEEVCGAIVEVVKREQGEA